MATHRSSLARVAAVAGAAAALLVLGWGIWCLAASYALERKPLPDNFGNFPRNVDAASRRGPDDACRFAVVGDPRTVGTFEALLDSLRAEPLDFVVLAGDAISNGTPLDHTLLKVQMFSIAAMHCPVFYTPGNHDVGQRFTLVDWEKAYGPRHFAFRRGPILFIFLCLMGDEPSEHVEAELEFLETTLQEQRPEAERVIVFNHISPDFGLGWHGNAMPAQGRLFELLREHSVDYFISGDYHSYARVRVGPTSFIVTGGGGSPLRSGPWSFHHAAVFLVKDSVVQERLCVAGGAFNLAANVRTAAIVKTMFFTRRHPIAFGAANVVLLVVVVLLVRVAVRGRIARPAGTSQNAVKGNLQ